MKTSKLRVGRFVNLLALLMWLAISTRPYISNAGRSVARYCSAPKAIHWKSALGILAYIKGTCGFGIGYQQTNLSGEEDADKQLPSNMYRRSTTETIVHPIGQNIPVIYPHFKTAIFQPPQFTNLEYSKNIRPAQFPFISFPLCGTSFRLPISENIVNHARYPSHFYLHPRFKIYRKTY